MPGRFTLRCDAAPLAGLVNMRIDAELLDRAVAGAPAVLRLYTWREPTLSLGYFQKSEVDVPPAFADLPRVVRLSGGGAILHDHELTYSLVLPRYHPLSRDPSRLYARAHSAIVRVLNANGLPCKLHGERESPEPRPAEFLCFQRRDPNDIVAGTHKIAGSAQRRRKGAVLQHGSILLRASEFAPHIPGTLDLGSKLDLDRLRAVFAVAIRQELRRASKSEQADTSENTSAGCRE